jgi:hypothetical protein
MIDITLDINGWHLIGITAVIVIGWFMTALVFKD